ncbi:DUF5655 domain-containing protein [Pedobacter mendelii]
MQITDFLNKKTDYTLELFLFFIDEFNEIGEVELRPLKSMIAIQSNHNLAYITQLGENFVHIVFPFNQPFNDNFCFTKIAQVPGISQYNHHLRLYYKEDINDEVRSFMKMAYQAKN